MKWFALTCFMLGVLGFGVQIARFANWYWHFTGIIPNWFGWGLLGLSVFCFMLSRPRVLPHQN